MRALFLSAVLVATSIFGASPASAATPAEYVPGPPPCYLCDVENIVATLITLIETPPLGPITCAICGDTSNGSRP